MNAGVLKINNTSGSGISPKSVLKVNHGATLSGNGAIGMGGSSALVVVNSGGRIEPGDGVGTLTLRDGLKLNDGARMQFEIGDQADLLRISGGTFQGSSKRSVVVTIKDLGGVKAGRSYNLIDFTGASFIDVDANDFPSHKHTVVKLGNIVVEQGEYDDEGNETKAPVYSTKYHVDVLWNGSEIQEIDEEENITYEHPYGWKSYAVDIDSEGVHSFMGVSYQKNKM